jgi:hypothetical protein
MVFRERHLALTGVLLALLLLLAGCGGGGGSTEGTSASTGGETTTAGSSESGEGEEAAGGEEGEGGGDNVFGEAANSEAEKEKFVEDVNAICFRHSQEQADQVEAYEKKSGIPLFEPNQKQQEGIIVKVIIPIVRETIAELEEYEPATEEAKLNAFIQALDEATTVTEKHPNFLAEEGAKEPYNEARARAGDMGTYLCGQA